MFPMEQQQLAGDELAAQTKAARTFSGALMREQREKKSLSRPDLVIALYDLDCRVAEMTLLRYETGVSVPDVNTAGKIAQALGVRLDNLMV